MVRLLASNMVVVPFSCPRRRWRAPLPMGLGAQVRFLARPLPPVAQLVEAAALKAEQDPIRFRHPGLCRFKSDRGDFPSCGPPGKADRLRGRACEGHTGGTKAGPGG